MPRSVSLLLHFRFFANAASDADIMQIQYAYELLTNLVWKRDYDVYGIDESLVSSYFCFLTQKDFFCFIFIGNIIPWFNACSIL